MASPIQDARRVYSRILKSASTTDDFKQFADELVVIAERYEDAADNIEDGFGHATDVSENNRWKADLLRRYAIDLTLPEPIIREFPL